MNVARTILSVIAALILNIGAWVIILMYPSILAEKATGLAVIAGGFRGATFSPAFWLSGIVVFLLFFYAGRLKSKALRVLLFWIPTAALTFLGSAIFALIVYVYTHRFKG